MASKIGKMAEDKAADYLSKRGLKILGKNISYPFGEIDLVACEQKTLVFIEVKYRRSLDYGLPYEAVSRSKQKKIILAAKAYCQSQYSVWPACRFDVLSLYGDLNHPTVEHIVDAFWDEDP